jgi:NAD(P)-dependent dehydrogenase (short-subunit alcohol dehydrogenase family)
LIHYNSSAGPAEQVVNKIKGLGVQAVAVKADASSAEFGKTLVNAALKAFNTDTIDIIVNNAGHAAPNFEGIKSVGFDEWDPTFQINVRGPFVLIQAALPYMKEGGRIINVGSIISRLGSWMLPVYSAAKGALTSMTVAISEELGAKGITANVVSPGPIATDLSMKGSPIAARLENNQHIKREGTPKEVGETILFMASPAASYITGQVIHVDGGIAFP